MSSYHHSESTSRPSNGDGTSEYLFDMIAQLAQLARGAGETQTAIYLEAILAARRAMLQEQSS